MSFFQSLLHTDRPATPLSRYTCGCGLFYLGCGAAMYAWPGLLQFALKAAPFAGREEGMMRLCGFTVAVIGYFYVFGSRTRRDSFGLATVLDRLAVPFFLLPLGASGAVEPVFAYVFSVLDPLLGLGAYLIWRRTHVPVGQR